MNRKHLNCETRYYNNSNNSNNNNNNNSTIYYLCAESTATRPITDRAIIKGRYYGRLDEWWTERNWSWDKELLLLTKARIKFSIILGLFNDDINSSFRLYIMG
jgi:hypothetical protein